MKRFGLVLLCLCSMLFCSYGQVNKIEDLKKKTKKELIDMAVKYIDDADFHKENYDRVQVLVGQTKMYVIFDISIRYVPVIISYYVPVYVDMVNGQASIQELSNSGFFSTEFYDSPATFSKQIKFVLDAIKKSDEWGLLPDGKVADNMTMNIKEAFDHYNIELFTPETDFTCVIDKLNGKLSQANHGAPTPKKETNMVEMK